MFASKEQQGAAQSKGALDIDWAICLVRWGVIAGIPLVTLLDVDHRLSLSALAVVLVVVSGYNLAITLLLAFRFFPRTIAALTLIGDTFGVVALLHVSGGTNSLFYFYPIFPILETALRTNWQYGLLATGVYVLSYVFWTATDWQKDEGALQIFAPALHLLLYLLAAAVGGVLSRQTEDSRLVEREVRPRPGTFISDRVKLAYEMASTLSATLNYQRVLEAILDISRLGFDEFGQRMGESVGLVMLYDDDGLLSIVSHRNLLLQADENRRLEGKKGIVEQAIGSAAAVVGKAPASDPELQAFRSLEPYKSMICVPLRAGFETYGAVLFASVQPDVYTDEHVDLLTIFCSQATIALQNASLYQSLREERDKIINKEEEARHKLARDLHDGPTQDVAAIAMRLNFARLLVERDPARARAELARLEDLAHRTVKEIRSMLFTLRPVILETEGLVAALNQYADTLLENNGLSVEIDAERYQDCLDLETQGVVFAIVEEAVNNAKKHAEASHIWVRLAVEGDLLIVQVVDNGRGFDIQTVESDYGSRGSLGMINLKERAELVEGNISIESTPGEGTRVTLLVPTQRESL
jgi:signal transduction histidine kinase